MSESIKEPSGRRVAFGLLGERVNKSEAAAGQGERSSHQDRRSPSSINKAQGNMAPDMYNVLYLTSMINTGAKEGDRELEY